MSPSWRERVRIALLPHEVALVRLGRGSARRVIDRKCIPCPTGNGQSNWAGTVEALHDLLAHPNLGKGEATLILSNHFIRYAVLPWSAQLVTQAEEQEFARVRFAQVYGQAAHDWSIVLSPAVAGAGRLCAAVDQALIAAVTSAMAASTLRLVSLQPALMAQFNEWRRRIGDDAWVVTTERGRLLVAWICRGEWRSVRMRPLNGAAVVLGEVLEQERLLLSAEERQRVFLAQLGDVAVHTDGLNVERLVSRAPRAGLSAEDAGLALAMTGL